MPPPIEIAVTDELWLAAGVVLFLVFLVAMWLRALYLLNHEYKEAAASYQMRRDKAATTLFNTVISGRQQKFAVFLRPFYTTDKIYSTQTIMVPVPQQSPVIQGQKAGTFLAQRSARAGQR